MDTNPAAQQRPADPRPTEYEHPVLPLRSGFLEACRKHGLLNDLKLHDGTIVDTVPLVENVEKKVCEEGTEKIDFSLLSDFEMAQFVTGDAGKKKKRVMAFQPATSSSSSSAAPIPTKQGPTVWLEKYRPRTLDEVVGNSVFIQELKNIRQDPSRMTHLMLTGPPGVGKTTCVHALAMEILGPENYKLCVLELNASNDRGIDVIRSRVQDFAKTRQDWLPKGVHKIIILDEVDSMTESAQQALRVLMEEYQETTRFALACNNSSKVIEAVQSRCVIQRFQKVNEEEIAKNMKRIIEQEKVQCEGDNYIKTLCHIADGDMRVAVNALQSCWKGFGLVNEKNLYRVVDIPSPHFIKNAIDALKKQKPRVTCKILDNLRQKGFAVEYVANALSRGLRVHEGLNEGQKLECLKVCSEWKEKINDGGRDSIYMAACVSKMLALPSMQASMMGG